MTDNQTRWITSMVTIVVTVVGSALGLDVRQGERVALVKENVVEVSSQNREILQGLSQLLDSHLATTEKKTVHNEQLNLEISELAKQNRALNTAILERIERLEKIAKKLKLDETP